MSVVFDKPHALTDAITNYCPGCTHGIITRLVAEVIDELGVEGKTVGIAPVGCSVLAYNFLQSARLLAEAICSFRERCAVGIRANREKMRHNLHNSLMLVTALNPYIGYENAAKTAKKAFRENISLKQACVELGFLSEEEFDRVFHPEEMI